MSLLGSSLAAVLIRPGEFELRSFKLPDIGSSEALIRVRWVVTKGGVKADVVIACAPSTSAIELGLKVVKTNGEYVIIANTEGRKSSIE